MPPSITTTTSPASSPHHPPPICLPVPTAAAGVRHLPWPLADHLYVNPALPLPLPLTALLAPVPSRLPVLGLPWPHFPPPKSQSSASGGAVWNLELRCGGGEHDEQVHVQRVSARRSQRPGRRPVSSAPTMSWSVSGIGVVVAGRPNPRRCAPLGNGYVLCSV